MAKASEYPALLNHILQGEPYMPLIRSPRFAAHRTAWRQFIKQLIACPPQDLSISMRFHMRWHESHHFIRELVGDDALMLDLADAWLPRYIGEERVLYRGENIDRFDAHRIGSAWTDQYETAEIFAGGLNAVGRGGLILKTTAPPAAIIAGPSEHSAKWLNEREYTVDPRRLVSIDIVKRFAANP